MIRIFYSLVSEYQIRKEAFLEAHLEVDSWFRRKTLVRLDNVG